MYFPSAHLWVMPAFFQMMSFKQVLFLVFCFTGFLLLVGLLLQRRFPVVSFPYEGKQSWVLAPTFWQGACGRQAVVHMLRDPVFSSFPLKCIFPSAFTFDSWFPFFLSLKIPSLVDKGWCLLSKCHLFTPELATGINSTCCEAAPCLACLHRE